MRHWLSAILLMFLQAWVFSSQAAPLRAEVFEDPSGDLTIEQVTSASLANSFMPMGDTLARGYTESAFWLKVNVQPHEQRQYLRVRPPYLDRVTLYRQDPDNPTAWLASNNGDRVPMSQRQVWGLSLLFALPPALAEQTVYLRLQTQSSSLMNIDVLTLSEFQQQAFYTMLWQLLLIAVMLGILIWAALDYAVNRQRIVGVFLLVQVAQVGYVLAIGGYLPLLFTQTPVADQLTSVLVVLTVGITLMFHRLLLVEFKPNRWALGVLNLMIAASMISLVSIAMGNMQLGLPLASSIVLLLIPILLWLAFSAKRNQLPGLVALRVTYSALAAVLCFVMAPLFGIWVSFDLYVWATSMQGLLTGLIMAAFLFRRSIMIQRQSMNDQMQLVRVQEKLVSEQQRAADQRKFLDMLAHELKTPLGVIQLTLDSVQMSITQQKRLHRSLDTMAAVIDRCRLSLQLDEGRLTPNIEVVDIAATVHDLVLTSKEPDRIQYSQERSGQARTDRQLLLVILHNLIDNALKYSPPSSKVTVTIVESDRTGKHGLSVTVHNQLTRRLSVAPDKLFEKYFRGSNAIGQTGSGLGLHLSQRLAAIIDGHLWAEPDGDEIKLCLWIPN